MTWHRAISAGRMAAMLSGYRGVIAIRWLGIALLLVSALTTPHPEFPPGSIAVAVAASGYNIAAMLLQRRGDVVTRVRVALLAADFVGCLVAMLSVLSSATASGPAESIGLLLIGVEAVILFDLYGYAGFSIAAPPALALAAWAQSRVTLSPNDAAQWAFTWVTFFLLLGLIAVRGRQDTRLRGELRLLSVTDDLTGLANRRSFRASLVHELHRSKRTRRPVCVLMLDLDNFKRVNDTYGHGTGDEVLANVGAMLLERVQRSGIDVAARVGGEEFAVILPETDEAGGAFVAERLRLETLVRAADILTTISIGVAASTSEDDPDSLLLSADRALYAAKARGRNCVCTAGSVPASLAVVVA